MRPNRLLRLAIMTSRAIIKYEDFKARLVGGRSGALTTPLLFGFLTLFYEHSYQYFHGCPPLCVRISHPCGVDAKGQI